MGISIIVAGLGMLLLLALALVAVLIFGTRK
jgi:hypothetical protein